MWLVKNTPSTPAATAPDPDHVPMISPPTPAAAAEDRANVSVNQTPSTQDSLTPSTQESEMSMFVDEEEEKLKVIRDELCNTIEEVNRINFQDRPRLIRLVQNRSLKTLTYLTYQVNNILTSYQKISQLLS